MKRRVFVGIAASPSLAEAVSAWRAGYETLPVRWLARKNLHLTLVPPWYEDDVEAAAAKLKRIASPRAFGAEFAKVAYGPDPRRPRLIWAEGRAPKEMHELKEAAELSLGRLPEKRAFALHLTLARFRPETFASFPVRTLDEPVSWREQVRSFALFEAHLSLKGADYEILEEIPL